MYKEERVVLHERCFSCFFSSRWTCPVSIEQIERGERTLTSCPHSLSPSISGTQKPSRLPAARKLEGVAATVLTWQWPSLPSVAHIQYCPILPNMPLQPIVHCYSWLGAASWTLYHACSPEYQCPSFRHIPGSVDSAALCNPSRACTCLKTWKCHTLDSCAGS